jgi:hypothetical protein
VSQRALCLLVLAGVASGCEPELVVGKRVVVEESTCVPEDGGVPLLEKVVEVPWSTGFEDGICDYRRAGGFCFNDPGAVYEFVEDPVHGGNRSAAFLVSSDPAADAKQTRCFLEGQLPTEAVYGAWFYVPELATNTGNWNLVHFQGGVPPMLHGLWDVSLGSAPDGSLYLYIFDFLGSGVRTPDAPPEVPIGSWFHVEFRLRRAADATGEVELRQDGVLVMALTGVVTDDTDFGQWYVGNLVDDLTPPESTVYVDDVTTRAP